MVVVRRDDTAVQRPRAHVEAVVGLAHVAAQRGDLGGQRSQPVGLVVAQVRDAAQPGRAGGERRHRGEHRCELADVAEVEVDALDAVRGR